MKKFGYPCPLTALSFDFLRQRGGRPGRPTFEGTTVSTVITAGRPGTPEDLGVIPTWLVQYNPRGAREFLGLWNAGDDFAYPAVDRHVTDIAENDFVLFWVSGKDAGVIGWGIASGQSEELRHPKDYRDPDGPRALRTSAEVALCCTFDEPIITREELQRVPEFDDFDRFRMPNRPNAFEVTEPQWRVILRRLEEVLGR